MLDETLQIKENFEIINSKIQSTCLLCSIVGYQEILKTVDQYTF